MLAFSLKDEIYAINDPQGKALADGLVDIAEHYGLTASRTVMLWVNLGGAAAMIYGPKMVTIAKRGKKPQATPSPLAPVSIVPQGSTMNFGG